MVKKVKSTKKIQAVRRSRPQKNERLPTGLMTRRLESGQWVDPFTAQRVGAVWRCVNYLSGIIAQLPWLVYKPLPLGGFEPLTENAITWMLNRRPNPEMSAFKMRELAVRNVLLRGNFIAEIERSLDGRPQNLWPIDPTRATLVRLPSNEIAYQFQNADGTQIVLPARDVFHVCGPSEDGLVGIPLVFYASLSIGSARAVEQYGGSFFENNGTPSGVLVHPKTLDAPTAKRIEDSWKRSQGGRNVQNTAVLEEGMEYKIIGVPPEQAQFLDTRRSTVEEICRWFGVPLQKVMATQQATYRNMEQFNREVVTDTVGPIMKAFEQEADYKLLSDNWGGSFSRMDTRELLRGDSVERSTYWKNLFTAGAVSVNEIRESEGMPPVPGGDKRYIQINMGPIQPDGTVGVPAPAETPDEEPDPEEAGNDNAAPVNGGDTPPVEEETAAHKRLIDSVVAAINGLRSGPRGPRGQRGPRGPKPVALRRSSTGLMQLEFSDGTTLTEEADDELASG